MMCDFLYMIFVLCLRGKQSNQTNKQTDTTVTRLANKCFKTQSENTYLIKLKGAETFREKIIF